MYDLFGPEVVERQCQLTEVEFDAALRVGDPLRQVVAQVASQKQVRHHEHVLFICGTDRNTNEQRSSARYSDGEPGQQPTYGRI